MGDGGDQYTGLDRFGRVIDQRWIKDSTGADLERVEYGFDRVSNRVWRNNTVANALSANQDEYYTYDGLNQLLTLQRGTLNSGKTGITGTPTWEEDFTFDPTGNWNNYVNQVSGTTTLNQPRTHNAVNEVETINGSSALIQQNAAGNMVKAPQPTNWSSAYTMTYDAWQRLVKVKSGSTTTAIYAYDGHNRRTTKVTGSTTRHYYYSSQWQILEERLNTTTTSDRQFVWGLMALDNLILRDRGSERFYSLQDVFSCTAIADISGTIQERYGYNAFGLSRVMDADFNVVSTSSYDWETRYDCYRFDAETSFYQVRTRYLHPNLGRWLIRDFIEYEGGTNLYNYVGNDPTSHVDEYGLLTGEAGVVGALQFCADLCTGKWSIKGWIWAGAGAFIFGRWVGFYGYYQNDTRWHGTASWLKWIPCGKCACDCDSNWGGGVGLFPKEEIKLSFGGLECGVLFSLTSKCSGEIEGVCLLNLIPLLGGPIGGLITKVGSIIHAEVKAGAVGTVGLTICAGKNGGVVGSNLELCLGAFVEVGWGLGSPLGGAPTPH